MKPEKYKLLMPNHIVVKDGLACGDKVILLYDFEKESMLFQIISEGCNYCKKMCQYLQSKFNHQHPQKIVSECQKLFSHLTESPLNMEAILELSYKVSREECYLAPIRILVECAQSYEGTCNLNRGIDLCVDKMECDACAVRENVSWLYDKPSHKHGNYEISNSKRKALMMLGRVTLKSINLDEIKEVYKTLNDIDFEFMEEYKLLPMVYQNLKKLGVLDKEDTRWRLLLYQRQRTVMARQEISTLSKFIHKQELKAFFVKGAYTHKFYSEPVMRNLTDFDVLAIDENDAFELIGWLLKNNYKIFPDSFSLKKTRQLEKNVYTGHLHFQKIINMQYRLIVDINFTGFPMIRVASYVPAYSEGNVQMESLIVVALCHLFKHKEVFMKDINDLYLMLISDQLRIEVLREELLKNNLVDLFAVAADFITREYDIPKRCEKLKNFVEEILKGRKTYQDWPYSVKAMQEVKIEELQKYAEDAIDYERIYLYPVIMFQELCDINSIAEKIYTTDNFRVQEKQTMTENLVEYIIDGVYLVLSPIGWFLEMKEHYRESMKEKIRILLNYILKLCDVKYIDIPYAIAFEEKWLDTDKE